MTPKTSAIVAITVLCVLVIIPIVCFFLYRLKKARTCLVLSHFWCILTFFVVGVFFSILLKNHFQRPQKISELGELLRICQTFRMGDTKSAIENLDNHLAQRLYQVIHDIPRDKIVELDKDSLWVLQQTKEYFYTNNAKSSRRGSMVPVVRRQLEYVPLSKMQLAIQKFEQTYKSGESAPAPKIDIKSWISPPIPKDGLKNKVILLDFWNTRCGPCVKSMPALQGLHDKYKDQGLLVIGCAAGNKDDTKKFLEQHGYSYPGGMASGRMILDYAIRGNPSYFLINRSGYLVWGPEHRLPTDEELLHLLNEEIITSESNGTSLKVGP